MKHVLFVDDQLSTLEYYISKLKEQGYEVDTAFTGQDALDRIRDNKYDLIVLDIMMPYHRMEDLLQLTDEEILHAPEENVKTGVRIYRELSKSPTRPPIVILSARSEADIRRISREMECELPADLICLHKGLDDPADILGSIEKGLH